jgi:hypothetical protein
VGIPRRLRCETSNLAGSRRHLLLTESFGETTSVHIRLSRQRNGGPVWCDGVGTLFLPIQELKGLNLTLLRETREARDGTGTWWKEQPFNTGAGILMSGKQKMLRCSLTYYNYSFLTACNRCSSGHFLIYEVKKKTTTIQSSEKSIRSRTRDDRDATTRLRRAHVGSARNLEISSYLSAHTQHLKFLKKKKGRQQKSQTEPQKKLKNQ